MPHDTRVLLVNDQPDARTLLRRTLQRAGFKNIVEAPDGRAAVYHLRSHPVDLLITDVHMPHLDGWRLARMVRSGIFKSSAAIPIIVVSATFSDRIAEATAKEFGVSRFLALKDRRELVATVHACLGQHIERLIKPRLLVVEDDPASAELVRRVLHTRFEIEVAADGQAGLEAWRARRHDLVLLDAMLPKLSGADVLGGILRIRPTQAVVVITADATIERSEALMLEGAADFIAKPFQPEQLRRVCEIAARREDYMVSNEQFAQRLQSLHRSEKAYRKVAEAHQRLLDNLGTVIFELDSRGEMRFLSRAWQRVTGLSVDQSLGQSLCRFLHPEDRNGCQSRVDALLAGTLTHCELEARIIDRNGEVLWADIAMDVTLEPESTRSVFGRLSDITDRKRAQQQLEYLSMHDALTGLFNRHHFDTAVAHLVAANARSTGSHAVLYLDLDHFKVVNDTLGHHQGDVVLQQIAAILAAQVRQTDTVCRLGGDEFGVLLANCSRRQALAVANELRDTISAFRYEDNGQQFAISCSIGISIIGEEPLRPEEYLMRADIALYVAKKRGRDLVHVYDPDDRENRELRSSIDWSRRIRDAIAANQLELYLQPIVHLADGRVCHYEALLRLHTPEQSDVVTPGIFIPALEQTGQMGMVDHWVIAQAASLLRRYPSIERLAVNLSAHAFRDEQLVPLIRRTVAENGIDPCRIIFEITETASIANLLDAQRMMAQLRELGCRFALDDFGTGFSTFTYLRHFPADYLKLDGSFIRSIHTDEVSYALVKSIHEIAHVLGKETIAEGVEDAATLAALQELGIDHVQGYYIGRPAPATHFDL